MKQIHLRSYIIFLLILSCTGLCASTKSDGRIAYPGGKCYMFRVTLKDKSGTPYSLDKPEKFLSKASLQRRERQGLKLDSTDLPVSPNYIQQIKKNGGEVVAVSKWNNSVLVRGDNRQTLEDLKVLSFVKDSKLVFVSPDSIRPLSQRVRYNSELQSLDSTIHDYYGMGKGQIESLNGRKLHDLGFMGQGMTIAILDAGFMNVDKIPAFKKINIKGTHNFVAGYDNDVYKDMDHGTKTLSTIAINQPTFFVGTAPKADFWLFRTEDYLTESSAEEDFWIAAVEFSDSVGVDVISSSLGYHGFDDKSMNYRYADLDGQIAAISKVASRLASKGMILINSAGNDGMGTWKKINVPADAHDILTVGAVSLDKVNAPFSSIGPTADGRVKPDVMAYGCPTNVVSGRGYIVPDNGTSFACPLIAGMVACLWQAFPNKPAKEIIDLVRQSGNNYQYPDNIMGYGIPDFWSAYQSATCLNQ